ASELGERYASAYFDTIFCSDLERSYKTAEIAFRGRNFPIIKDPRLRECDYGDMEGVSREIIKQERVRRIKTAFPNGESYEDTSHRMKEFLRDLSKNYEGKKVMIIGHRATQYGLEHWINRIPLEEVVTAPWKWQPGWTYVMKDLN
ncbi:MAG: histidine phosphatase family protein, partial [Candidatus Pacebacteria bacterium]|nr:histidine phosphatase family protein [Candidatus Paceibacterota bacterium]